MKADVNVVRVKAQVQCAHCEKPIAAGELVHLVDRKTAMHVQCDLRRRSSP